MDEKTCPQCGLQTACEENFCGNCGYDYTQGKAVLTHVSEARIDGYLEMDIAGYVCKKEKVYLEKFEKVEQQRVSLNWSALIFTLHWLLYRKMYGWATLFYSAGLLSGVVVAALLAKPLLAGQITELALSACSFLAGLVLRVALGFLADRMYWRKVKRALSAKSCKDRPAERDNGLQSKLAGAGGVSPWAVVLGEMTLFLLQGLALMITPLLSTMLL